MQNCFVKDNVFGTEPVRRRTLCMVRNRYFRGTTNASTPFGYKNFDLNKVELLRGNSLPFAGTPLDTQNDTRLYYNTVAALGFERSGNKITLEDCQANHFYLMFDLTSTTEACKSLAPFFQIDQSRHNLENVFQRRLTRRGSTNFNWRTIHSNFHWQLKKYLKHFTFGQWIISL